MNWTTQRCQVCDKGARQTRRWVPVRLQQVLASTHHTAEDAHEVEFVQASVQEGNSKERCKEHLSPPHHLVD